MKNVRISYFFLALFITCNIMLIKNDNFHEGIKDYLYLRRLLQSSIKDYACSKAGARITDKYDGGFDEEPSDPKENLTASQNAIINFARNQTYHNIAPLIKKLWLFIAFLILDIIFIFVWITYCSCYCCKCCLFKQAPQSQLGKALSFSISALFNIVVIILSIIILIRMNPFFQRINGLGCTTMMFLDHMNKGLSPQYPPLAYQWEGFIAIIQKFGGSKSKFETIDFINVENSYNKSVTYIRNKNDIDTICLEQFNEEMLKEDKNNFYDIIRGSFANIDFTSQIKDINKTVTTVDETCDNIEDNMHRALHNYINSHIKNLCLSVFSLNLILGAFSLIFTTLYFFLKRGIFRRVYVFVWNFSFLFMILAIFIGVIFGVLGNLLQDGVQVFHYILSSQNIYSKDPLMFANTNEIIKLMIDDCANGEGDFMYNMQDGLILIGETEKILFESRKEFLILCDAETIEVLTGYYNSLLEGIDIATNISTDLFNIKCGFAKNDKNIILNEADRGGEKGIFLSTLQFCVGISIGISALGGIIFAHRYKLSDQDKIMRNDIKGDVVIRNINNVTTNTTGNMEFYEKVNKNSVVNINENNNNNLFNNNNDAINK